MRAFTQKVIQCPSQPFAVEKSAYGGLDKSKDRHPEGKQNTPKEGRKDQGLVLKTATKVK
jgi:hypothetical protein